MEKNSLDLEKITFYMIYGSLLALSLGLVTSISILSLYHILLIIPILFFLPRTNLKSWSVSTWALVAMTIVIICSIIFNQDIAVRGYKPMGKVKYFFFGFLSILPLRFYFEKFNTDKRTKTILYTFFLATSFATIIGVFSRYWEFNPVTWRVVSPFRNAGLFGMVMNYAHNLAYFQIIVTGLLIYRKQICRYVNLNILYATFAINLIGLYLTYTRGAWLAFCVGVVFFFLKENKKIFFSIVICITMLGALAYYFAGERMIRPQSDKERLSQWQAATIAFKERPILGYGYLNFEQHSLDIKKRYNIGELHFGGHAHGNLFEMLGSTGALGVLTFVFWLMSWFVEMYRRSDLEAKLAIPFIIVLFVGGVTQSTIALGVNLFFIMAAYSLTQVRTHTRL